MKRKIPLLKEYRLYFLIKALICFDNYPFEREKQRNCIIKNYSITKDRDSDHWDKSIFRGMVIPSLKF